MPTLKSIINNCINMQNYAIDVKISGKKADISGSISHLEFDGNIDGEASICILRWQARCYDENETLNINNSFQSAQVGVKIEVSAGYCNVSGDKYSIDIFSGFIFSSSIVLEDGISYFEISGMDAKIWMMANNFTQFKSMGQKYSKIVQNVLDKYSAKFKSTKVEILNEPESVRPGLHQRNESDFDFLNRIASVTGSIFYVVDGNLMFTSFKANDYPKIVIEPMGKIKYGNFLQKIEFKSNIVGIPKSVSLDYTEAEDYTVKKSSKSEPLINIGNGNTADNLTSNINDNNFLDITSSIVDSQECAQFLAKAAYTKCSLHLAKCRVICKFIPDIKVGSSIQMSGFGIPIDNNYIVSSLNHKYDGVDFTTSIELSTDAFSVGGTSSSNSKYSFGNFNLGF